MYYSNKQLNNFCLSSLSHLDWNDIYKSYSVHIKILCDSASSFIIINIYLEQFITYQFQVIKNNLVIIFWLNIIIELYSPYSVSSGRSNWQFLNNISPPKKINIQTVTSFTDRDLSLRDSFDLSFITKYNMHPTPSFNSFLLY